MQNQNDIPRVRAKGMGFKLVQFDLQTLLVVQDNDLKLEGIIVKEDSALPNFSPVPTREALENTEPDNIFYPQYQYFGRNNNFCIFSFKFEGDVERKWMIKSNFTKAQDQSVTDQFMKVAEEVSFKKWLDKQREITGRMVQQNADMETLNAYPLLPSIEAPNPGGASYVPENMSDIRPTRGGSQEWSGETPPPTSGAIVEYGIDSLWGNKRKYRGLVRINNQYEFQELRFCPPNLLIPGQRAGMAPKVDNAFVASLKKGELDHIKKIGCTAKWDSRPKKQTLVILQVNDSTLREKLKRLRSEEGYQYEGPLVCTFTNYKKAFGYNEEDIIELEELLSNTAWAQDATEDEISLRRNKTKSLSTNMILKDLVRRMALLESKL